MDEFTMQIVDIINKEAGKRAEEIFSRKLNSIVVSLARDLSIEQISCHTQLSCDEVRDILQNRIRKQ